MALWIGNRAFHRSVVALSEGKAGDQKKKKQQLAHRLAPKD